MQRRLKPRSIRTTTAQAAGERIAIILDTETTDLDQTRDEVIELAMVAFTYRDDGRIGNVVGEFTGLREPTVPICPEITRLTGITPEMIAGQ